jgi:hypothetical protein
MVKFRQNIRYVILNSNSYFLKNIRLGIWKTWPYQLQLFKILYKDLCIRKQNNYLYFKAMYFEIPSER